MIGADDAGVPSAGAADRRCVHGLDGRSGIRCPACRRGLGAAQPRSNRRLVGRCCGSSGRRSAPVRSAGAGWPLSSAACTCDQAGTTPGAVAGGAPGCWPVPRIRRTGRSASVRAGAGARPSTARVRSSYVAGLGWTGRSMSPNPSDGSPDGDVLAAGARLRGADHQELGGVPVGVDPADRQRLRKPRAAFTGGSGSLSNVDRLIPQVMFGNVWHSGFRVQILMVT